MKKESSMATFKTLVCLLIGWFVCLFVHWLHPTFFENTFRHEQHRGSFFRIHVFVCKAAILLTLSCHQERIKVVRSNKVARNRPARRHSRNGLSTLIQSDVCLCNRNALGFKMLFFRSFVTCHATA